jgi:hypothetical protein
MRRNIGSLTFLRVAKVELDAAGTDEATLALAKCCSWRLMLEDSSATTVVLARPQKVDAFGEPVTDTAPLDPDECIVLTEDSPETPWYPTTEAAIRLACTTDTATVRVEWESQTRPT